MYELSIIQIRVNSAHPADIQIVITNYDFEFYIFQ